MKHAHLLRRALGAALLSAVLAGGVRRRAEPDRRRRHVPVPDLFEVVRRLQAEDRRRDQLPVDRQRRRHPAGEGRHRGLRRQRRGALRRGAEGHAAHACCTSRPWRARWCSPTTCPTSRAPLQLTPDVITAIYLGRITVWNDKRIAAANPGVRLPAAPILAVHRSDGSGTTNIYTNYLAAVSAEWKELVGAGTSVSWPSGVGGKGNDGVAGVVKQTPGAIGYVELAYAKHNQLPDGARAQQGGQVHGGLAGFHHGGGRGRVGAAGEGRAHADRELAGARRLADRGPDVPARLPGRQGRGPGEGAGRLHRLGDPRRAVVRRRPRLREAAGGGREGERRHAAPALRGRQEVCTRRSR